MDGLEEFYHRALPSILKSSMVYVKVLNVYKALGLEMDYYHLENNLKKTVVLQNGKHNVVLKTEMQIKIDSLGSFW